MATGVVSWSKNAATNASSDSAQNWAEGMAPSAVNDSARGGMASVAKFRDDINGSLTTAGTSTAYTLTTNQVFASLTALDTHTLTVVFHATSGATPTLSVDSLTAKPIRHATGATIPTGALVLGTPYRLTYFNTAGEFLIDGSAVASSIAAGGVTYASIQNVAASRLLGNPTGSPAAPSEISLGASLGFVGTTVNYAGPCQSGRLTYTSTTALAFLPYHGDLIRISGVVYQIPASTGIAGLGNPTSVFLNSVAAQTLVINTTYYIYAFNNSGTITADFSVTGHVTSSTAGNIGTEIKSGDDTRTLIGMVRTGGTVIYASDLQTISWFNRRNKMATQAQSFAAAGTGTAINFVTWSDEALTIGSHGLGGNSGNFGVSAQNTIDGSNVGSPVQGTVQASSTQQIPINTTFTTTATEANHAYNIAMNGSGGTTNATLTSAVMIRG